ncbi:hypothetical protein TcCL_ESM04064 [Trypanosoma cruzi]|nr:hypothetical protein TcCL_ESM04064 [Trypanosoma cruzi]
MGLYALAAMRVFPKCPRVHKRHILLQWYRLSFVENALPVGKLRLLPGLPHIHDLIDDAGVWRASGFIKVQLRLQGADAGYGRRYIRIKKGMTRFVHSEVSFCGLTR